MSYSGFDQEEIQQEFHRIKGIKAEYDGLTPEEKKSRTYTLGEMKYVCKGNDKPKGIMGIGP